VVDQNVSDIIDGPAGEVVDACFTGAPLVPALGLSSWLNFTEVIKFPSFGFINESFEFEQLDAFEDNAFSTNFTTFYSAGDEALVMINNLTAASPNFDGIQWTRDNIDTLNASLYYEESNGSSWYWNGSWITTTTTTLPPTVAPTTAAPTAEPTTAAPTAEPTTTTTTTPTPLAYAGTSTTTPWWYAGTTSTTEQWSTSGQYCQSHDDCPSSQPFCYGEWCAPCNECRYCSDGVDGTCGSCGMGYPLYENVESCSENIGSTTELSTTGEYCQSHDECPSSHPLCFMVDDGDLMDPADRYGHCESCNECGFCIDGVDLTCGPCGDGYPLWENAESCSGNSSDSEDLTDYLGNKEMLDYLQRKMMAEAASISAFNDTVYKIRANLSAVDDQVEWLQRNVQDLVNNVDNASALLKPLFEVVIDVENAAECGFVGDAYQDTKSVMCSAVLGSLSRIVVAMFVIAVLSMVGCMWSIQLVRRVDRWQVQKKEEKEDKLQQSMQPKKPSIILMQQPQGYQQPGYGVQL